MSKKKDTFMNMVVSLFVITIISGFSLGYVNDLTVGPKAKARLQQKVNALKLVLPEFDNNPVEDVKKVKSDLAKDSIEIYPAFANNEFVGKAIIGSSEKGFSGLVKIMVGFKPDGAIQNIVVLEQKETPVMKDGGEVDALTGATISSRAFTEATQMAYDEFVKNTDSTNESKN
jgi:electron transport complex protein RnfG